MRPPVRFTTTADDVTIAYATHGEGRPMVMVRGWFSHLDLMWDDAVVRGYHEALGRAFTVVRYDSRGNGLSDRHPPDVSLEGLVADLEAVMDAACDEPAVLFAVGYGGPVAVTYACHHPHRVSHLVLFGTRARPEGVSNKAFVDAILDVPEANVLHALNTNPDDPDRALRSARHFREVASRHVAAQLYRVADGYDVSDLLPDVRAPSLVVHPRRSKVPFVLGREMATLLPDATFVALDGADWNPWNVQPDRSLQAIADFTGADLGEHVSAAPPPEPGDGNVFRREGEYWTIVYEQRPLRMRDSKGLQYLARLVSSPGREFHAGQLASPGGGAGAGDADLSMASHAGDSIDPQTRRSYERRLGELRSEAEDARRWDDGEREARAEAEMQAIASELSSAIGLGGRPRRANDPGERLRKAVTNRIRDTMRRIRHEHPGLGAHLDASVRTGTFCAYEPAEPVSWTS